jgi:hypothetical protein
MLRLNLTYMGKVLVVLTISRRLKRGARKDDHGRKGD